MEERRQKEEEEVCGKSCSLESELDMAVHTHEGACLSVCGRVSTPDPDYVLILPGGPGRPENMAGSWPGAPCVPDSRTLPRPDSRVNRWQAEW